MPDFPGASTVYLGDGVYARRNSADQIEIWISNGITEGPKICLERHVYSALADFAKMIWRAKNA